MWRIPAELLETRDDEKLLEYRAQPAPGAPRRFLAKVKELYESSREDLDTLDFKDGRAFERYSRPLMMDERVAGRVWSFRDVTERKRAERTLAEQARPRSAHRPAQPPRRPRRDRTSACAAKRESGRPCRLRARPRQVQVDQRQLQPRDGRQCPGTVLRRAHEARSATAASSAGSAATSSRSRSTASRSKKRSTSASSCAVRCTARSRETGSTASTDLYRQHRHRVLSRRRGLGHRAGPPRGRGDVRRQGRRRRRRTRLAPSHEPARGVVPARSHWPRSAAPASVRH